MKIIYSILTIGILTSCVASRGDNSSHNLQLGKYYTAGMLGTSSFDFHADGTVIFRLSTDIAGFSRIGSYLVRNDTIEIIFEPLIKIDFTGQHDSATILNLQSYAGEPLTAFPVSIFVDGKRYDYTSDLKGGIILPHIPASIDSTYWDWRFEEFGLYPGNYSNLPAMTNFSVFNVVVDTEITSNWPYATDQTSLLIIGHNKLFNGTNYDPNAIYPADVGILIRR